MGVDADAIARWPAQELVDRHPQRLALDIPERHVDPAQRAGQDGAASIERVAVNRLPVMHHAPRVLPQQVGLDLLDRFGDGQRPPLDDRLAESHDPRVGVHFQEEPARLDQQGLQLRDLDPLPGTDRCIAPGAFLGLGLGPIECRPSPTAPKAPARTERRLVTPRSSRDMDIVGASRGRVVSGQWLVASKRQVDRFY